MNSEMFFQASYYHPNPGERVRILVRYNDAWRPIFWLEVEKDGSIYLGFRKKNAKEMRTGIPAFREGESLIVRPEDGQEASREVVARAHASVHSSGIINITAAHERFFRDSLRTITEQQELCIITFEHPNQFSTVANVKSRDVCLDCPFSEQFALCAQVYVAPRDRCQIVSVQSVAYQTNVVLGYSQLVGLPGFSVQLVFYHGTATPWPKWNLLLFRAKAELGG
jgi:hypothetical protein